MRLEYSYAIMYGFLAVIGVWQFIRPTINLIPVDYAPALESTKLIREWCTWLATLSTASIGASAYASAGFFSSPANQVISNLAIAAFVSSLVCTATLLLSLPSIVLRLKSISSVDNDTYELVAFLWIPTAIAPFFRIGFLAFAQYYFFLLGIIAFAINASVK